MNYSGKYLVGLSVDFCLQCIFLYANLTPVFQIDGPVTR